MASGPALTLSGIEAQARLWNQDTDSTNAPGLSSANYTALINPAYFMYFDRVEPRYKWVGATLANLNLSANDYIKQLSDTNCPRIREIKAICYEGVDFGNLNATQGYPIAQEPDWLALMKLIGTDIQATTPSAPQNLAKPTRYAVFKQATEPGSSLTTRGTYKILFYPICDATRYFSVVFSQNPTALSAATDTPDVSVEGSYILAQIVGAQAAVLLRRPPDFVQSILASVPQDIATMFSFNKLELQAKVKDR